MAATIWKTSSNTEILISGDPGNQFAPSIADSGGGSFGVAWTSATGVTVRFYYAVGAVDPALGTIQLSDGLARSPAMSRSRRAARSAMRACGRRPRRPSRTLLCICATSGSTGTIGGEIVVVANAGVVQHNAAMSGYSVDDPGHPEGPSELASTWVGGDRHRRLRICASAISCCSASLFRSTPRSIREVGPRPPGSMAAPPVPTTLSISATRPAPRRTVR